MKLDYFDRYNKQNMIVRLNSQEADLVLDLIRRNLSFNLPVKGGFISYIANADGTQGILSKVESDDFYIFEEGKWVLIKMK
jgi:hypothetical protein